LGQPYFPFFLVFCEFIEEASSVEDCFGCAWKGDILTFGNGLQGSSSMFRWRSWTLPIWIRFIATVRLNHLLVDRPIDMDTQD